MRTLALTVSVVLALVARASSQEEQPHSRVIVSTTLNSTLQVFDAETLAELQPPLPSRGGGPVRLWVQEFGEKPYLLAANHGIVGSSVGVFDLSGDVVLEMPLSPAPAPGGLGAVGIAAGMVDVGPRELPMVFMGNTYFALAPCDLAPRGSVTGFDASLVSLGLLQPVGTVEIAGGLAWGVSLDGADGLVFATSNCAGTLDTLSVTHDGSGTLRFANVESRPSGAGSDGTIFDAATGLNFTVNISESSISVHGPQSPGVLTKVPVPGGRPIDLNLADSSFGKRWLVTSNGGNDTVGLVDRDIAATCAAAVQMECPEAFVANLATGVPSGQPEGVDFDSASNRIFVVNKPIPSPSLSVIEIDGVTADAEAPAGYTVESTIAGEVPLTAIGSTLPLPALIAFDVVVQER